MRNSKAVQSAVPDPAGFQGRALAMIGALYLSQGVPMGVAFEALPAILRKAGYSTEAIGLIGLMMIPWATKFLWAPFVDRHGGGDFAGRRRWIVPAQLILAVLFFLIAFLPRSEEIGTSVLILLLLANIVSATQDIATDGLAVEILPDHTLGWVNSVQIGGFALGMLIGGGLMVVLYDQGGWVWSFGLLGMLALASLLPVLLYKPRCEAGERQGQTSPQRPSLMRTLRRQGSLYILSIAGSFHFGRAMASSMTGAFLVDIGFSLSDIGVVNSAGITAVAVFGALAGGYLVRSFGMMRTAIVGCAATALALFLWLIPALDGMATMPVVLAVMFANGIAGGAAYVAFFVLFMRWASIEQAGTDFTLLQCTETCTNIAAFMLGGAMAGAIGFEGNFIAAGVISLALFCWIAFALSRLRTTAFSDVRRQDASLRNSAGEQVRA